MASGRQLAEENWLTFQIWSLGKTDEQYRQMVHRGTLSRSEIAAECGFSKSVLLQNPKIREALKGIEDELRARGVLPALVQRETEVPGEAVAVSSRPTRAAVDAERLKRLEQENASLRLENDQLRTDKFQLQQRLTRYAVLAAALDETGRVPR